MKKSKFKTGQLVRLIGVPKSVGMVVEVSKNGHFNDSRYKVLFSPTWNHPSGQCRVDKRIWPWSEENGTRPDQDSPITWWSERYLLDFEQT